MGAPRSWYPFEEGSTIGAIGSEGGSILEDEEYGLGARITLEQGGQTAPFAITCGIYGFMMHTTWARDEAEAKAKFEAMKSELVLLLGKDSPDDVYAFIGKF